MPCSRTQCSAGGEALLTVYLACMHTSASVFLCLGVLGWSVICDSDTSWCLVHLFCFICQIMSHSPIASI